MATASNTRLRDLDVARGLAMVLVVVGHVAADSPPGNGWYGYLKWSLYLFHMPLFFFLSGYATSFSLARIATVADYGNFLNRRLRVLVPVYVLYGLLALAAKTALLAVAHRPPAELTAFAGWGLKTLVTDPMHGPARQIWFLYVLVLFCLLLVPVLRWHPRSWRALLGVLCVAFLVPLPHELCLRLFITNAPFFVAGVILGPQGVAFSRFSSRAGGWALAAMVVIIWAYWQTWWPPLDALLGSAAGGDIVRGGILLGRNPPAMFFCAWLSIPAVWFLVLRLGVRLRWLEPIGRYSLAVFLLHQPLLAFIRLLAGKAGVFGGIPFRVLLPIMVALGLCIPVLLKTRVFSRITWLDRLTG